MQQKPNWIRSPLNAFMGQRNLPGSLWDCNSGMLFSLKFRLLNWSLTQASERISCNTGSDGEVESGNSSGNPQRVHPPRSPGVSDASYAEGALAR